MIFQDPYASLDPRMTVGDIIGEGIDIHELCSGEERQRAEQYRIQLWAYSEALSRVLGEPVCRRVLYFFATGTEVEL